MQSGIVLFLGMARRGECESLEKRGLPLGILVDTNNKQKLADVSRFELVERFDFSRPIAELIDAVRSIQQRRGIACLYNVNELYVAHAADVAAALGMSGVSPSSARLSLDKNIMRQRFVDRIGAHSAARFRVVTSESDLLESAHQLGYPVFLQPTNVSASMWATRNETREELLASYRAMRNEVPRHYEALGQKGKELNVVVAEYLEGANTSIDCLSDRSGLVYPTPIIDVLTGRDIGIDDFHHFARIVPTRLAGNEQNDLAQLAAAGVRALDVTSCATHVEFIGSRLGEIAARPGGNRPRILELAYGIDYLHAYYQILYGLPPDLQGERQRAAAIVTPFPSRKGTLRFIRHLDQIAELPGYFYHEVRGQPGQPVGLSKSGYRAPLYIELVSTDADEVRRSVDRIASWTDLYEVE